MCRTFSAIGIMDGWKVGDLPGNQMVNIVLNRCMTLHDGSISLTSQLVSDGEGSSPKFAVNSLRSLTFFSLPEQRYYYPV